MENEQTTSERELERGIDSMLERINCRYGADLTDEAKIDVRMGDILFRNELKSLDEVIARLKKISERTMHEQKKEIAYYLHITVTGNCMHYYITRNEPKCSVKTF